MDSYRNPLGGDLIEVAVVGSTMDEARRLAASGVPHGTVVRAAYQTRGRGRFRERSWEAEPGTGVLMTALFEIGKLSCPPHRIPLLLGLAVARTVDPLIASRANIKWPNDVLVDGCKIAGVLCESDGGWVFGGIGINCNQIEFDTDLRCPATSIAEHLGATVPVTSVFAGLLAEIETALSDDSWLDAVNRRLAYRGWEASIVERDRDGSEPSCLRVSRIGIDGELILVGNGGERGVFGGEIAYHQPGSKSCQECGSY